MRVDDDSRQSNWRAWLGHWPVMLAIFVWIAAVAWPMLALVPTIVNSIWNAETGGLERAGDSASPSSMSVLIATSIGWSLLVAACASLIGWLPGRALGRLLGGGRRSFVPLAAIIVVPLCLPSYLVFYAWWQSWPAGTALHRWVIERDAMQLARDATLLLGLVCWSWPLIALCVAGAAARRPRSRDEMLAIDGAPAWRRSLDRLRSDAPGLAMGFALVFLATLNNTTCFDLAEVFTFANELRARQALGATPAQVLEAALPMMLVAGIGAMGVWWRLGQRNDDHPSGTSSISIGSLIAVAAIWIISVILPLAMFWRGTWASGGIAGALSEYRDLYVGNTLATLLSASASGLAAAFVTFGLAMMWHSDRLSIRIAAHVVSISWLLWSLLPGTILGLGLHQAWNRGVLAEVVFRRPVILNLAHLAGAGFIAALLARWSVCTEPRSVHDLRRIDGAMGFMGLWRSARPSMLAASIASGVIVAALAASEIAVTAQVVPPLSIDRTPIAMTLLNEMHYQRPQTVMVASAIFLVMGLLAAFVIALVWRFNLRVRKSVIAPMSIAVAVAALTGCSRNNGGDPHPLDVEYAFGAAGQSLGQFGYPRCIDVDATNEFVYVIDKSARVQRFGFDGQPQIEWAMPEKVNGKPTGITVAPNGHVFVADTHYFRVIEYDRDGNEVNRFGFYGEGDGQFIYLTDVAIAPDGNLYVSEYGGNDRIQVFTSEGKYLFQFGSFGRGENEFSRPQGLAFSKNGSELFITDACNHRIVVTDAQGKWIRAFGSAGREPGQLAYPYGIEVLPDGSILVAEFGNNRIQRFAADGRSLGVYGSVGRGEGELQYPWAVAAADDRIFVLDSGNNRVQVIDEF